MLTLTALVLLGHWLALGGRIELWPARWFETPSEIGPLPRANPSNAEAPGLPPTTASPALPAPATVATVRWISPAPPPEPPAPEPAPPPAGPVKIAKKAPPPEPEPASETPEPAPAAALEMPVPEPGPFAAPPPLPFGPVAEPPPPLPLPLPPAQLTETAPPPMAAGEAAPALPAAPAAPAPPSDSNGASTASTPPPPQRALALLPDATLNYDVKGKAKGFNYHASGTLSWRQDGATYAAQLKVSAFLLGTYVQSSTGRVTPQGLAPERFSVQRRSGEKTAYFERATGRIRYSNKAPAAPLLPDAQDQLSVTLQLASLLNTYANLGGARTVSMPVSSDGSSEPWQFEVGAVDLLVLPAGEVKARQLTRAPRREGDKTVQLWLAPGLAHLPVRMRITEHNGDFLDMLLEDLPTVESASSALPDAPTAATRP
jgi:hypothetical protein